MIGLGSKFMRMLAFFSFVFALLPAHVIAQEGLGQLDYTGQSQNRPAISGDLSHPNGAEALCFALPGGSCNADDCGTDRERAQLLQRTPDNLEGMAYRYSVSFFLPADFEDVAPANVILWEVKPRGTGKPSAVIEIIEGYLQFSLSNPGVTQADMMNPERPIVIQRLTGIPRNRWTDMVIEAKWSRGVDGYLRVFRDGARVVDHQGPNIDSNSARQQVMFGIYRSFISRYLTSTGEPRTPDQQACFANVSRQELE